MGEHALATLTVSFITHSSSQALYERPSSHENGNRTPTNKAASIEAIAMAGCNRPCTRQLDSWMRVKISKNYCAGGWNFDAYFRFFLS